MMPILPKFPLRAFAASALAALLLACATLSEQGLAPAPASGPPIPRDGIASAARPSLMIGVLGVRSFADRVRLSAEVAADTSADARRAWLVAVPPGDLSLEIHSLTLRDSVTHATLRIDDAGEIARLTGDAAFARTFAAEPFGVARRVALARVVVRPGELLAWKGATYALAAFDVSLRYPAWRPREWVDSALSEPTSNYRAFLSSAVANPEMIDAYAQPDPPAPSGVPSGIDRWHPEPGTSQTPWLRIPITQTGLYAIDGRWLGEHGIETAGLNPARVMIFSRGERIPVVVTGPAGATFGSGARLLFHATESEAEESRERAYYLGYGPEGTTALTVADAPAPHASEALVQYPRRQRFEQDNLLKTRYGSFLSVREMDWVWQELVANESATFAFRPDGLGEPIGPAHGTVALYFEGTGLLGRAALEISVNGQVLEPGHAITHYDTRMEFDIPAGVLKHEGNTLGLRLLAPASLADGNLPGISFDALELEYDSLVTADDGRHELVLDRADVPKGPRAIRTSGFRGLRLLALDVTDERKPLRLPVENGVVDATLHAGSHLLLVEDDTVSRAPAGAATKWRPWSDPNQSADVVIVTHADFAAQAEDLASTMRAEGREVLVADVASLYENYTWGEVSPAAVRAFLRDATMRWTGRRPTHAILVGDCTSDGRGIARNGIVDYVPTHVVSREQANEHDEYACDGYMGWLAGEDEIADILIGRLSVANVADATEVVRKAKQYRTLAPGEWSGRILDVTDPGEFRAVAHTLLHHQLPASMGRASVDTIEYPWEDNFYLPRAMLRGEEVKVSPIATSAILERLDEGVAMALFFGHGSPNIWSNQRIWFGGDTDNSDNLRLSNADRPFFMASFTCNNGAIDYPMPRWNVCIAEDMMRVPNRGAIGCFVPSGPGYSANHLALAEGWFRAMSDLNAREFGVLAETARLNYQALYGSDAHSRMFILLGDPTLRFPIPSDRMALTVEPEVIPYSIVDGQLKLHAKADDALATGTAVLYDSNGQQVAQTALATEADGSLAGTLKLDVDRNSEGYRLLLRARTTGGEYLQLGKAIGRAPQDVLITRVDASPVAKEPGTTRLAYTLENQGDRAQSGELTVTRTLADGAETIAVLPFALDAGQSTAVMTSVAMESGAYLITATVTPNRSPSVRRELPSAGYTHCVVVPRTDGLADIAIPAGAFDVLAARVRRTPAQIETWVANPGSKTSTPVVTWRIVYPDGHTGEGRRQLAPLPPGTAIPIQIPTTMELEMTADFVATIEGAPAGVEDADPSNNRLFARLRGSIVPDLMIVPDSIRVTPRQLAESVTVFVEGTVENFGLRRSPACRVGLFPTGDPARLDMLRSLAGQPRAEIPPLGLGEKATFRIRWDPTENLDIKAIQAVVDADQILVESNKANNAVTVPVDIRSRWRLALRGMEFVPNQPRQGTITLMARVANEGQTDARRVVVKFYADAEQSPENYIGEVLVDRLPAGQTMHVPFVWDLEGVDVSVPRRPSFTVQLKGSLQRLTSVLE